MNIRPTGRGVFYTRDSGGKHETTPAQYIQWASNWAREHGVELNAETTVIGEMVKAKEFVRDDVYLDYEVSGNLMSRPALDALLARVHGDERVSHIFIPRRDRLARPDDAVDGVKLELQLRKCGVSIVFMDRFAPALGPKQKVDVGEIVTMAVDYDHSGRDRRTLAEKMIYAKLQLWSKGFSGGGRPPYGFSRWLVRDDGTRVRELEDGEKVRKAGHHVAWQPLPEDHPHMKNIRRIRLLLRETPASRVAAILNEEGVPSPDAGRTRTDLGLVHYVSGKWNQSSVSNIGRNSLLAAISEQGRRSMGDELRLTPSGPREIDRNEMLPNGKPRVVRTPSKDGIRAAAHFEPIESPDSHASLQKILDQRATTQAGKPRSRTPSKNPMGTRIIDMHCGCPMYRQPHKEGFRYVCSQYSQSKGKECGHHRIDGVLATKLVLGAIAQRVVSGTGQKQLREKLEEIAAREFSPTNTARSSHRHELGNAEAELAVIGRNLSRAADEDQYEAISREFAQVSEKVKRLKREVESEAKHIAQRNPDAEIALALQKLADLPKLLANEETLESASKAIQLVNARLFLSFRATKLKKRIVNRCVGGVMTFGDATSPVQLNTGPTGRRALESRVTESFEKLKKLPGFSKLISSLDVGQVSLGNVSRSDRI